MNSPISVTHQYLLAHYGPLLTLHHLAEVLHTSYNGLRMAIVRGRHPLSVGLADARRTVGRRVYFDAALVAAAIDGASGSPPTDGERNSRPGIPQKKASAG